MLHRVQADLFESIIDPKSQIEQELNPDVAAMYPSSHSLQLVAPSKFWKWPGLHLKHPELRVDGWYSPSAQGLQMLLPVVEVKCPAMQSLHPPIPVISWKVPISQLVHVDKPVVGAYVPEVQSVHILLP